VPEPVSHLNAIPIGDRILVTWRGGDHTVSVFVSDDPDDAGIDVHAPDAVGRAIVPRTEGSRSFVHLFDPASGFLVAAERRVEMDGPTNLRDLGGYPTRSGRQTRWGRVFRSDRLDALTDADFARLIDMGITKVFDLRADAEVAAAPDRLPDGITHVRLPMSSDGARARTIMERIDAGLLTRFDEADMANGYLVMLEEFTSHFSRVIDAVASGERVLFHCTAGKDRTGVMAMVLLAACGVGESHLLDDYELTNSYAPMKVEYFAEVVRSKGLDPDSFTTLWSAPRPVMRAVLNGMAERWGDINGYLAHAGIDPARADALRSRMVYDDLVS